MRVVPECLEEGRSESPSSRVALDWARPGKALRQTCFTRGPVASACAADEDPLPPPPFSLVLEPGQCSAASNLSGGRKKKRTTHNNYTKRKPIQKIMKRKKWRGINIKKDTPIR